MKLVCILLFGFMLNSCYSQKRKITFVNLSPFKIDSLQIGVSSADTYSIKFLNIAANDSVFCIVPYDKPRSNKHDITVSISVYIKKEDVIHTYDYDDLGSSMAGEYRVVLNKEKKLKWVVPLSNSNY